MDPKLAEMYGTDQVDETDVEKLAAAELAEQLSAEDAGFDTDDLTDEDVEAAAQEILDGASADMEEPGEDAVEKVAEADYLGRVMAHAFVQESREIEKEAGAGAALKKGGVKAGRLMERLGKKIAPSKLSDKAFKSGKIKSFKKLRSAGSSPGEIQKMEREHHMGASAGARRESRLHKGVGAGAIGAGAAAVGAGAYGAHRMMKKSSAVDTLAEARALEILEQSGIDPSQLTQEQEKISAADAHEVLAATVEERAWDLLNSYGVVPSEE